MWVHFAKELHTPFRMLYMDPFLQGLLLSLLFLTLTTVGDGHVAGHVVHFKKAAFWSELPAAAVHSDFRPSAAPWPGPEAAYVRSLEARMASVAATATALLPTTLNYTTNSSGPGPGTGPA